MKGSYRLKVILLAGIAMLMSDSLPVLTVEAQKKTTQAKKTTPAKKSAKSKSIPKDAGPKTSAEAKKQQQAAEREIKQTEAQLEENEKKVKKELTQLGKLEGDINETKGKINVLNGRLTEISQNIRNLESSISRNEKELEKLRAEYLKAVKKMRVTKKNKSEMAFIFSSGSFNQALRRLRYLKEFSAWRGRQTNEINSKIADLKNQKDALAKAREEQKNALALQQTTEKQLETQHQQEEVLIGKLKANSEALQSHLQKKQAEANRLNGIVSNLIAQEQQQAEERRKAEQKRLEEQRIAEQRRQEEQRKAEQKRQEEQRLAEQRRREEQQKQAEQRNQQDLAGQQPEKSKADDRKETSRTTADDDNIAEVKTRQRKKKEVAPTTPTIESKTIEGDNSDYANIRKRAPRSQGQNTKQETAVTKPATQGSSFQDMKGRLPRPVNGSFKVTSRFGRQSLPDLPGVEYDNPGIDAEVASGTSAVAVFKGKVSGVYLLPGYNTVVIVNHDGYYTVYGNISSASVKIGDMVSAGQALGVLANDEDNPGHSSIHFEVWKNRDKLNPMEWIR